MSIFRTSPRRTSILLFGCLPILLIAGCGGGAKQIVGKWDIDQAATFKLFPSSEVLQGEMKAMAFSITFEEDGNVVLEVNGNQQTGTWKKSGDVVKIKMNGKDYGLRLEDDILVDYAGGLGVAFRKTDPNAKPPPELNY